MLLGILSGVGQPSSVPSGPLHAERVWNLEWGENMYLGWYLVWKECGNIYLDIDATTGSRVSGIRDGTATGAPL